MIKYFFTSAFVGILLIGAGCNVPEKPYVSDVSVPEDQDPLSGLSAVNDESEDTGDPVANGTAVGPAVKRM